VQVSCRIFADEALKISWEFGALILRAKILHLHISEKIEKSEIVVVGSHYQPLNLMKHGGR